MPFKVSFASAMDETAEMCDLILPDSHFLESWGDSSPREGVTTIQQPVMQPVPLFDSKSSGDALLSVMGHLASAPPVAPAAATAGSAPAAPAVAPVPAPSASTFYEYLRNAHMEAHDASMGDFETAWREALRSGVVTQAASSRPAPELRRPTVPLTFDAPPLDGDGDLTLLVQPSARFAGGEFSNVPWLQELPDPVSKIMWHSWLEMNPKTAEARGLQKGDIVTVASPHGSLEVPLWTYPGIREDAVALAMGGGHTSMGRYANGAGVNALDLLPPTAEQPSGALVTTVTKVTVTPTGQARRLVTIEGSDSQHDRPIAPAVQLERIDEEPVGGEAETEGLKELQGVGGFVPVDADGGATTAFPLEGSQHGPYAESHDGPRWAMAIDMDKCTGCSSCVTACQAENNIPWVGEEQVLMGRDMNWIRIERYYEQVDATQAGDLDVRFLMMLCQHCGNAPCEPVCPVFATYHTPEGANVADLQPLRGHPVLREQLPVQGARVQLVPVHGRDSGADQLAVESGRHGPQQRRHGEVLLLHAAHPRGAEPGVARRRA